MIKKKQKKLQLLKPLPMYRSLRLVTDLK